MVDSIKNPLDSNIQPIQLDPIERQAFEQQSKEQRFLEYNQQVIPTTFNEMLSASFDSTYQHGVGRKAFNLAERLTSTAPTVSAKELNERYQTDLFKYDVSEEQAGELMALVKRKEQLNRIISSGDGSFWSDKVPWFAGSMAGWFADPTSVPMMYAGGIAGNVAKAKALNFGASAVKAGIAGYATEALTTGVLQAGASQAIAPEALEERSAGQFAEDVALGMVGDLTFGALGAGAKKIYKAMAKAKPDQGDLGNKAMSSSPQKNASIQAYAQEAFKGGKKIDAEKLVKAPETKVKDSAKAATPENTVYVKKTSDGGVIDSSIADKKSLEATGDLDSIADGTGQAIAVTIPKEAKVFDVKADQGGFLNLFKKFVSDRNKQKYTTKVETIEVPRTPDPDDMVNVYHATNANFFDFDPDLANALVSFHDIKRKAENYGRDHIHQRQILKSQTLDLYRTEGGVSSVNAPEKWDTLTRDIVNRVKRITDIDGLFDNDLINLSKQILDWHDGVGPEIHPILRESLDSTGKGVNPNDLAITMWNHNYYTLSDAAAASFDDHLLYAKIISESLADGSSPETILNRLADIEPQPQAHEDLWRLYYGLIDKKDRVSKQILFGGILSGAIHKAEIYKYSSNGSREVNRILVENGLDAVLIGHGGETGRHYMLSETGLKATRSEEIVSQIQTKFGEFFNLIDELQKGGLDSPSIAKVMKAKDPELYGEFMDYMREQGYSVVDFGDRKLVLNPELLPNEEVKLNKEMLEPAGGKEELAAKLTSNEMDIEYSKEALDDVALANEELVAEVNRKFDEDATALINDLSTKEGESSIIKKEIDGLKEEMGIFTQIESAIKAFTKCVLKG